MAAHVFRSFRYFVRKKHVMSLVPTPLAASPLVFAASPLARAPQENRHSPRAFAACFRGFAARARSPTKPPATQAKSYLSVIHSWFTWLLGNR